MKSMSVVCIVLMNYQGMKKPAFYAYELLNKLGDTELVNARIPPLGPVRMPKVGFRS